MKNSDSQKKAKLAYLNVLAGNTAGNVEAVGKLKSLGEHEKTQAKKAKKKV